VSYRLAVVMVCFKHQTQESTEQNKNKKQNQKKMKRKKERKSQTNYNKDNEPNICKLDTDEA
jgi:hypothetical protein